MGCIHHFWSIGLLGLFAFLQVVSPCALPFWMVRGLQLQLSGPYPPRQSGRYYSNEYVYNGEYSSSSNQLNPQQPGGYQNEYHFSSNQQPNQQRTVEDFPPSFYNQPPNYPAGPWGIPPPRGEFPAQPNFPKSGGYHKEISVKQPNTYLYIQEYSEWTWEEYDPNAENATTPSPGTVPQQGGTVPRQGGTVPRQGGSVTRSSSSEPKVASSEPKSETTKTVVSTKSKTSETKSETSGTTPTETAGTASDTAGTASDTVETTSEVSEPEREDISNDVELSGGNLTRRVGELQFFDSDNSTGKCKIGGSDITSLRTMLEQLLSFPRDDLTNEKMKDKAREAIISKFKEFGLQVWTQNFTVPEYAYDPYTPFGQRTGVNIIGVLPGDNRGKLDDGMLLVGAHYDTVKSSNGVDDNGSGVAVMMETARIMAQARCRYNNTLMFVAFDMEEHGAVGSNYFVTEYLIPEELNRARAHFQGAFILDSIMNFNNSFHSQVLPPDFQQSLPDLDNFISQSGSRGDFLAMISRNNVDSILAKQLLETWKALDHNEFKLYNLAINMGPFMPPPPVLTSHPNFLSSDHATFWYHNVSHFPATLNAVLLTDTGPYRGRMRQCYHLECDDLSAMSSEKLQFAKKTTDALTATLSELSYATAKAPKSKILSTTVQALTAILAVCFIYSALEY